MTDGKTTVAQLKRMVAEFVEEQIDVAAAVTEKLKRNAQKYPKEQYRGRF